MKFEHNVYKILKPGGVFMLISAMENDVVRDIFSIEPWSIEIVGSENFFGITEKEEKIRFYHLKKPNKKLN